MSLRASVLVAEQVKFDVYTNKHSIGKVLNSKRILLPGAVVTDVYIKMLLPSEDYISSAGVIVFAPDNVIEVETPILEVKNYRSEQEPPGMDASLNVRFAATQEGCYIYRFQIGRDFVIEYPLYIYNAVG